MNKTDYIYKATLKKAYGLTDSWIERLGEPDKIVPNPYYSSRKSYLYLRARVEMFIDEHQDEYKKLLAGRAERSARARTVMSRRVDDLLDWAEGVELIISRLPEKMETLKLRTETSFTGFYLSERGDADFTMSPNAIIAYVRHELTNYEELLREIGNKPGCRQAYIIIRDRVDNAIEKRLLMQYNNDWLQEAV
jgi:hypothetical protein